MTELGAAGALLDVGGGRLLTADVSRSGTIQPAPGGPPASAQSFNRRARCGRAATALSRSRRPPKSLTLKSRLR
eukprot:5419725-Pyramimonas_sp.AAC.1